MTVDDAINQLTIARMELGQLQQAIQAVNGLVTEDERDAFAPAFQAVYQRLQRTIQHGVDAIRAAEIPVEDEDDVDDED